MLEHARLLLLVDIRDVFPVARPREVEGGGLDLHRAGRRRADRPRCSMQATVWTKEMQTELRRAFRRGKYGAARAAFPTMTPRIESGAAPSESIQ